MYTAKLKEKGLEQGRFRWVVEFTPKYVADKLIAAGVIASSLPAYVAHKTKVQNNFKVAYIHYL